MTTILNLPEEILLIIFDELGLDDLSVCHKVCRAWYSPSHVKLLKQVTLKKVANILQFIKSFDRNSDPLYLNAVKEIHIHQLDIDGEYHSLVRFEESIVPYKFGKGNIKKLFFRFPKLEKVTFDGSLFLLCEFDDEICEMFLQDCPNINTFKMTDDQEDERYHPTLHKLRRLITGMQIDVWDKVDLSAYGGRIEYLNGFHKLQEIKADCCGLRTFREWLPIIQRVPKLATIELVSTEDDQDAFGENYLRGQTKDTEIELVQRLAQIHDLTYICDGGYHWNSTKFIAKYLTGLTQLSIICDLSDPWTSSNHLLFCTTVSDLARSVNDCTLEIDMTDQILKEYLPIIVHKVFQQTALSALKNAPNRCLTLHLNKEEEYISLQVISNLKQRSIAIEASNSISLEHLTKKLFKANVRLHDVDEFILKMEDISYVVNTRMYDTFFAMLPSVKKITLDLPATFVDTPPMFKMDESTALQVEELTLCAPRYWNADIQCQTFLNECYHICLNLKRFNFYFFSGVFKQYIGEFQVELGPYTLETLVIDVATIRMKAGTKDEAKSFL